METPQINHPHTHEGNLTTIKVANARVSMKEKAVSSKERPNQIFGHITINDGNRTNNFSEGWNNSFRQLVGHNLPSIWRLILHLREDAAVVSTSLIQYSRGEPPQKRVKRATVQLQDKLKKLCLSRISGERSVTDFLLAIGHCIRIH